MTTLKLLKVEYGQGYYLARPAPIAAWAADSAELDRALGRSTKRRRRREAA